MNKISALATDFKRVFPSSIKQKLRFFFSPGRVNLMGDHIDYCGGKVLPAAIHLGNYFAACLNGTNQIHMYSSHFNEMKAFSLTNIHYEKKAVWANYPKGVFFEYQKLGIELPGMNIICKGDLPIGSALSSSASILVGTAIVIQNLSGYRHDMDENANRKKTARLCHRAEVNFNGLQCGIMDQAAAALGRKNKVMHLDCTNLMCEYLDFQLGNNNLLILNSGKSRQLTESKYNRRKMEADKALKRIQKEISIDNLCSLETAQQQQALALLERNEVLSNRARHIMSENLRVEKARAALLKNDIAAFGQLLNESHDSLKHDYAVTGKELDTLVYESRKFPGVLGARMTGAGFSGCTLTLIQKEAARAYEEFILPIYKQKCGLNAQIITMQCAAGAGEIDYAA